MPVAPARESSAAPADDSSPVRPQPSQPDTLPTSPRDLLWLLPLALALSTVAAIRVRDFDTFWHLATGRWIVEHRAIPPVDPFSFTAGGRELLAVPWLSDLVLYGAYALGGFAMLVVLNVAAAAMTSGLLILAAREMSTPPSAILAFLPFFVVAAQPRLSQTRPETFGLTFLSLVLLLILRFWRRRDAWLLALPVVTLVWIQAHAGAVLAVPVAGTLVVACLITRAPRRDALMAFGVFVATLALFGVTKSGRELVHLGILCSERYSPVMIAHTAEWRHPDFRNGDLWVPLVVLLASLVWAIKRPRNAALPVGLALLGALMVSQAIRHIGAALVLSVPLIAGASGAVRVHLLSRLSALLRPALLLLITLGLPLAHLAVSPVRDSRVSFGFGLDTTRFPIDTYETILKLPVGRTMNDYHLGGYLIWRRIPEGVFWDGRNISLYPDSMYDEALRATESSPALEAYADRWNIAYGLSPFDGNFGSAMMQSDRWVPVHHGVAATLFVRRKNLDLARQSGVEPLDLLRAQPDAGWMDWWYGPILRNPALLAELEKEIARAAAMTRDAPVLELALDHVRAHRPDLHAKLLERIGAGNEVPAR
ncbi:MAG: hypothetical protein HY898_13205 [Deltaproteobacteria bacterium]|nr:hypothetical protein [Deltaproteobacteria bacterium]